MISLLLGLSLLQDPLQKPVTFTTVPARAELVCKQLSDSTGVQLTTSQVMADEVLLIQVKEVPLHDLLQKIAHVTSGQWQQEKDTYRLVRGPETEAAEKKEEQDRSLSRMLMVLRRAKEAAEKLGPFTAAVADKVAADILRNNAFRPDDDAQWSVKYKRYQELTRNSPLQRAAIRFVPLFDASFLVNLRQAQYTFATRPTRMQLPLPRGADDVIRQFFAEQKIWNESVEKAPPDPYADRHSSYDLNLKSGTESIHARTVIVQLMNYGNAYFQITLLLADEEGKVLALLCKCQCRRRISG
jgi:hypothetical protein